MKTVPLGEVAVLMAGTGFPHAHQGRTNGRYPFAKVGDISRLGRAGVRFINAADNYVDDEVVSKLRGNIVPAGSTLFAKIGEAIRQGHRVIAERPMLVDNNVMAATPRAPIDSDYLFRFLQTQDLYALASSTTVPSIRKSELERISVPLPPMDEQQRLVAILDKADELRDRRRQALWKLDALKQSIFHSMFSSLAEDKWMRRLGDVARIKGGKRLPKGEGYEDEATPHPYIRVSDMEQGTISSHNLRFISPVLHSNIARYTISSEDVMISIAGTIGMTATIPSDLSGSNLTENAAKISPIADSLWLPAFMSFVIQTDRVQRQVAASTGQVTIGKLALFRIEELVVPVPPLELQSTFAERITAVEGLKEKHREQLAELDALFASLQHRAFKGEL